MPKSNHQLKGFELSEEVRTRLKYEPHGNQRLIAENLFRAYYGLPATNLEDIENCNFNL